MGSRLSTMLAKFFVEESESDSLVSKPLGACFGGVVVGGSFLEANGKVVEVVGSTLSIDDRAVLFLSDFLAGGTGVTTFLFL